MSLIPYCIISHPQSDHTGVARDKSASMEIVEEDDESKVNLANAVHLSDSEEEEEMEDIIDDFANAMYIDPVRPCTHSEIPRLTRYTRRKLACIRSDYISSSSLTLYLCSCRSHLRPAHLGIQNSPQ